MGKLSHKYMSNKAVNEFFRIFDDKKNINWLDFDAAVNNLKSKYRLCHMKKIGVCTLRA